MAPGYPIGKIIMNEESLFFSQQKNKEAIREFLAKIRSITAEDAFSKSRNSNIELVLDSMFKNPKDWSTNCRINIEWLGDRFPSTLPAGNEQLDNKKLDDIFSSCFRFLLELYLSTKSSLVMELEQVRKFAKVNISEFSDEAALQIEYAHKDMPIAILKQLINNEKIESLAKFNDVVSRAEAMKTAWDEETQAIQKEWEDDLQTKKKEIDEIRSSLESYKTGFNFVGLFQGFDELAKEKVKEKEKGVLYLRIFGALVTLPIMLELSILLFNVNKISEMRSDLLFFSIPVFSLMIVLIYFFRIMLMNYKSIVSQLLQLELRKTLCRFIQSYFEYSGKLSEKNKDSLEKFENIIFSGIVSDDEKIPSTFDGLDQIVKLINAVKTK